MSSDCETIPLKTIKKNILSSKMLSKYASVCCEFQVKNFLSGAKKTHNADNITIITNSKVITPLLFF